jgi:ribosomal protein S18 acetylase RimI-like enzyme
VNIAIRKAEISDSPGLARVQVDSYCTAYADIFPQVYLDHFTYEEQEQDWCNLFEAGTEDELYVAVSEAGEVVGYALGRLLADTEWPYDGELVALHVRKGHQRQGIGTRLVAAMAEQLQLRECASLMLWTLEDNGPARALYERLGGKLLGEKAWRGNEHFGVHVREVAYGWADIEELESMPGGA